MGRRRESFFYSESDIKGLHVEADTLEAFEALVADLGKLMQKVSSGSEAAR